MDWLTMSLAGTGYCKPRYRYTLREKGALNKAPFSVLNIIFETLRSTIGCWAGFH